MRKCSIAEALDVISDGVDIDPHLPGSFFQHCAIMDPLSATRYLFASHENVETVGIVGCVFLGHCVEGPDSCWVVVQYVEVGIVLLFYQIS